ncbi:MAG: hypothetical protein N2511_03120, partial [Thermodesulfovibrionales bacterium]|nr:hypothetical protein [Thermodesulfovibrionales bacterium]
SETSIALLEITLKKFYQIDCELVITDNPETSGGDAFFLIGDDALRISKEKSMSPHPFYIYDLGELWSRHTQLPFVFALWLVKREVYQDILKRRLLEKFVKELNRAKESLRRDPVSLSKAICNLDFLSNDEVISYWQKIDYDLNDRHKRALILFKQYLSEISVL